MQTRHVLGVLIALPLALSACKKEEVSKPAAVPPPVTSTPAPPAAPAPAPAPSAAAVTVSTITLGNAINTDRKVTTPSESFSPKDTIYAAVDTTGAGTATLKTKWTYRQDGQETVVKEDEQTIAPTGPATTEFHISKPDGWPAGQYQVQVLVNNQPAGTKSFTVK